MIGIAKAAGARGRSVARLGDARVRLAAGVLGSAALVVLAAPPFDLWPLAFIALVPLLMALGNESSPRTAFGTGWSLGFVINLWSFSWGPGVLAGLTGMPMLAGVAALVTFAAYQASVLALWTGGFTWLVRRRRWPLVAAAPLAITVAESIVPSPLPWSLAICAWRAWPVLQIAELGGTASVSALLVLINALVVDTASLKAGRATRGSSRSVAIGVVLVVLGGGLLRAVSVEHRRTMVPHLSVGVVQPNFGIISAEDRRRFGLRYLEVLRRKTAELSIQGADLIVWPETAFPFLLDRKQERDFAPSHPWRLAPADAGHAPSLLFGSLTHEPGGADIYNSAVLLRGDGTIAGRYDKRHLAPVGERDLFAGWPVVAARAGNRLETPSITVAPPGAPGVVTDGALRLAPLICYEEATPAAAIAAGHDRRGPNLLVTLANHAWFGDSTAPWQALAFATFRSIELRRDLVRATATGVSSIGDALGRVRTGPSPRPEISKQTESATRADSLRGEVALLDLPAAGPHTIGLFPWLCFLPMLVLGVFEPGRWRTNPGGRE
jgi:apolipoprotein N-acyltransferase